jgi:hypothetical protein
VMTHPHAKPRKRGLLWSIITDYICWIVDVIPTIGKPLTIGARNY